MPGRKIAVVKKFHKSEQAAPSPSVSEADEIFQHFNKDIEESIGHTSQWTAKQQKWHRLRMRIKKEKNFPFPNCSNIRMPTAEVNIRKIKASIINIIFGIRPIVQAIPTPSGNWDTAQKIEKFLDHLIMDIMDLKSKAIVAVDQELEKGFELLKPYWRFEITTRIEEESLKNLSTDEALHILNPNVTEDQLVEMLAQYFDADMSDRVREDNETALREAAQSIKGGSDKVRIELKDVLYDFPDVALVSPEYCYVPTDAGFDPQDCGQITHELFLPLRQIQANAKEKGWIKDAVNKISAFKDIPLRKLSDIDKDMREGIERLNNPSGFVRIWETYAWYDLNGDGVDEKCVFTFAPDFALTLRKISLPFYSGEYPFIKLFYELTDDRWFSHRGIPELLEDIIKEIDIQHMQKIDQQTVRNTPMFVYRAGMVNPNTVQFIPNQAIPIHGMADLKDTIDVLNANNPNVEYSYEREEQILLGRVEELIGRPDYNLQNQVNRRQPRTGTEVTLQNQNMQNVFSLDADIHTSAFGKLFNWIFDLWCQYGRDDYEFSYFGKNGWEKIRLTREECQNKYKIFVKGNDQNTNPNVQLNKAQTLLQMTANPVALQTGVMGPAQIAAAYKRVLQTMDVDGWEEFVNQQPTPQEPPKPKASELMKIDFDSLTDAEKSQILLQLGVKPDVQGRELNSRVDMIQKGVDIGEKAQSLQPEPATAA